MPPLLPSSQPWVEKYQPRQVKDVTHQEEVVAALTDILQTPDLPHMLFYGPPGTGKTTTALAIAYQLYGPELYKSRVLELNASDEQGINVVRTTIKDFATVAAGSAQKGGYPCPPYKIIILHEADLMTEDAQNVLGHIVETHSKVTRFFFICNYISRIREPIASRCAKFRFKPLPKDVLSNRILHICNEEGLTLGAQALSTLSVISKGDVRRAITYLQSAACLFGSSISPTELISISMIIEKISSEVKDLSGSKEIPNHLKGVSSRANEVVDEISSNVKDLSARSEEMTNHLKDLSSRATEILEIKIEDRAKRDLLEERRQKVTEDMATYLKEISLKSLSSRADEKDGVDFLKTCQSLLSDFVFFMLSLIPWLLYKSEKSPPTEYYYLLFSVTVLAFLGMFGYVLSHIARRRGWIVTVYFITAIAVMATIALVGYALFHLIPSSYEHYDGAYWTYMGLYTVIGIVLLVAWCNNFWQARS